MGKIYQALYGTDAAIPAEGEAHRAPVTELHPQAAPDVGAAAAQQAQPFQDPAVWIGRSLSPELDCNQRWFRDLKKIAVSLNELEAPADQGRVVMLSGTSRRAGTSSVIRNLARILATARRDERVLLLDFTTDASYDPEYENADVLTALQYLGPQQILAGRNPPGVTVMTIGIKAELASHIHLPTALRDFINEARHDFDWVLMDTPPFNQTPLCDPLARLTDGVVMVVPSASARIKAINALQDNLDQLGVNLHGVVLNFRKYPLPSWLLRFI